MCILLFARMFLYMCVKNATNTTIHLENNRFRQSVRGKQKQGLSVQSSHPNRGNTHTKDKKKLHAT